MCLGCLLGSKRTRWTEVSLGTAIILMNGSDPPCSDAARTHILASRCRWRILRCSKWQELSPRCFCQTQKNRCLINVSVFFPICSGFFTNTDGLVLHWGVNTVSRKINLKSYFWLLFHQGPFCWESWFGLEDILLLTGKKSFLSQ